MQDPNNSDVFERDATKLPSDWYVEDSFMRVDVENEHNCDITHYKHPDGSQLIVYYDPNDEGQDFLIQAGNNVSTGFMEGHYTFANRYETPYYAATSARELMNLMTEK